MSGSKTGVIFHALNDPELSKEDSESGIEIQHRRLARMAGMSAKDAKVFSDFCLQRHCLIISRCPNRNSRIYDLRGYAPKPPELKKKSVPSKGILQDRGKIYISDYDLMSVWIGPARPYRKVFFSEGPDGEMNSQAREIMDGLNAHLRRKLQHGANDDWRDESGKALNTKIGEYFVAWTPNGFGRFFPSAEMLRAFYADNGLEWPY
ncbi:hypothetical protein [Roseomonas sp. BN140053]|uniref:hypothetical protein n=1 Tax=Roseomonas sp. BN140053 TaxID=3391898 RepID=UPI0039E9A55B